jgi:hypothetical protein
VQIVGKSGKTREKRASAEQEIRKAQLPGRACARDFIGRNRAWMRADVDGKRRRLSPSPFPIVRRVTIMKRRLITAAGTVCDYVENERRATRVYFDRDETFYGSL